MAKVKVTGLTEFIKQLENVNQNTPKVMEETVKAGMQPVTDSLRSVIQGLKVDNRRYVRPGSGKKRYMMEIEKKGLLESMGYSPVRTNGTVYDSNAGVQGYNKLRTTEYKSGSPNKMLLDAIDSGTSFRYRQPIFSKVKKLSQDEAVKLMQEALEEKIMRLTS